MEEQSLALVLVVLVHQLCQEGCHGATEQNFTIAENSTTQFPCNVDNVGATIWLFTTKNGDTGPETISQGDVYPRFAHKFTIEVSDGPSDNSTSHSLTLIFNGTEEDEGRYLCQEQGTTKAQFNLVVEVPPVVYLKKDSKKVNTDIDLVFKKEATIECIAESGKPPVTLSWKVNGEEKTGPFIDESPPSSERRVTSTIHYIPNIEDSRLTCIASGQKAIPEKEASVRVNVQYSPNCVMGITNTTNAFVITCSCDANPKVSSYEIFVNGSISSREMQATLPSDKSATVYCYATNDIGSFETKQQDLKPFHEEVPIQLSKSFLVIGVCVTVVILFITIFTVIVSIYFYRKKKEGDKQADLNQDVANMALKGLPPEENFPDEGNTQEKKLMEGNDDKEAVSTGNEI